MSVIVFEDDFENNNLDLWTIAQAQWSTTSAQKKNGVYSAQGLGAAANRILSKTLPSALAKARVTFYVRANETLGAYYIISTPAYALIMVGGHFQYYDTDYHNLPVDTTFVANTWYKVEMEFVAATNSIKYWIEDAYKGEVTDFDFDSYYILSLICSSVSNRNMWLDDVVVENLDVKIAGTADGQATASATIKVTRKVSGGADATSTASAAIKILRKISGSADATTTAAATASIIVFIAATADAQSTAVATVTVRVFIIGTADAQATAAAAVKVLRKILCSADAQSTATMNIINFTYIACTADGQAIATCAVIVIYAEIPPVMHEDLIKPYGDMGAWLWLAEIVVPTQATQRIARNTVAVVYGGTNFPKGNFDPPGRITLAGDGSIPRIQLRVAQDGTGTLEGIVNATKGGENGTVKLIRTCEKYFNSPVKALERTYNILTAGSDPMWVTFSLGIPNPLLQRIPLWSYSSKVCPLATPSLFKGPRCQYPGEDAVCTGLLSDCRTKGNAVHWGAEIGLDPNAVRV